MTRPGSPDRALRLALTTVVDSLVACAALVAAVHLRRNIEFPLTAGLLPPEKLPLDARNFLLVVLTFVVALAASGFYDTRVSSRHRPLLPAALVIQTALIAVIATFLAQPYPRTILVAIPLVEALLFIPGRRLVRLCLPVPSKRTLLVSAIGDQRGLIESIVSQADERYSIEGVVSPAPPGPLPVPYLGPIHDDSSRARITAAEEIICIGSDDDAALRFELLHLRGASGFMLLNTASEAMLIPPSLAWIGDQPLVEIASRSGYGSGAAAKRALDLVGAAIMTIISLPLMAVIAALILLTEGLPVVITQERVGFGGRRFGMLKFRSLRNGSDRDSSPLVSENDERVTRVGYWLRKHRLDELPQLINVLRSEMSLVGPRPERPELADEISDEVSGFHLRLLVKPGIAGLAQVSGEYDTDPATKLRYDLSYICSWSLALDVKILLKAISTSFAGRGM